MIDLDDNRLDVARRFGASDCINAGASDVVEQVQALTGGLGVDSAIEAVGVPSTFTLCESIIAPGGDIAVLGVHGKPVELHLERLWSHNITLRTRLVDAVTTPMLLKSVEAGKLQPEQLITHHFALADILAAYETFGKAAENKALKMIIEA
ncbi:putative zinc-type alcohol dehydrogenase-like protein YjmD [compost metagenome]